SKTGLRALCPNLQFARDAAKLRLGLVPASNVRLQRGRQERDEDLDPDESGEVQGGGRGLDVERVRGIDKHVVEDGGADEGGEQTGPEAAGPRADGDGRREHDRRRGGEDG